MTSTTIKAKWVGQDAEPKTLGERIKYVAIDQNGKELALGKGGFSPARLVLMGLAGCTGMDVVSILDKKKQAITNIEIEIIAHQPDKYPKPYETIELKFIVTGNDIDPDAVARAIELSESRYCIVAQTLKTPVDIKTSYKVQ